MRYAAALLAGATLAALASAAPAAARLTLYEVALAKYAAAWAQVRTYTGTVTVHEVLGSRAQDRVYHLWFSKPHDTRMDIVDGDGRGGAAVWHGGDRVYGHQGGLLRFIRLHLDLHDRRATSIRGTTIADANFGALYDYLTGLKASSGTASIEAGKLKIIFNVANPGQVQNITKEVLLLDARDLPLELRQYEGDQEVKHVVYSDVRLNVDLPASTWDI